MRGDVWRVEVSVPIECRPDLAGQPALVDPRETPGATLARQQWRASLRTPLPDVCVEHGRPAVTRRSRTVDYRGSASGWWPQNALIRTAVGCFQQKPGGRDPLQIDRGRAGLRIGLAGDWPVCERCIRLADRYTDLRLALFAGAGLTVLALLVARLLELEALYFPLAVLLFPGWLPIGLLAAVSAGDRRVVTLRSRINPRRTQLVLTAHPGFAAAVGLHDSRGRVSPISLSDVGRGLHPSRRRRSGGRRL